MRLLNRAWTPSCHWGRRRCVDWYLIELIKVDLEQRWLHSRGPKQIEDYLADFPELRSKARFATGL